MVTIDYTGLRLTGALRIEHLTDLTLHVGVNDHGWAVVEGEAGEDALEQLQGAVAGREQVIMARDESGVEQPLFAGIIHTADLVTYGGYNRLRIELQSGTILMDRVKKSRSFQDVGQTYSQVAQRVASGYEDGAVISTVGQDKPLGVPVIQFRETDWEFLKRMASWCGGVVVPETHYAYPRIWFGFPERAFTCAFPEDCYTTGISQRYYELGGPVAGYRRADFLYYDVPSSQLCDLGWYTVFKGQEFLICEKWAKLERGELTFIYRLGKLGLGWGRKQYNEKISGMTILGEVLSTERETVRLKLNIDEGWNPGGPYAYTWRPETGNMMYCMPQAGTRVSLYFPNYDEQAAMAVNCVRTNGASCDRMSDPSRRSFVTEHGKEMNLYPDVMSLLGGANGTVKLEDATGITLSTDKKITIVAQEKVSISAKSAIGAAPMGEIVMAKGNALSGEMESTQVQSNQYDLLSTGYTHMEGRNQQTFEACNDAPQEGSFDWGRLIGNVVAGLAVVAAVAFVVGTAGLGAPVVVGAIAVGSTAVIGQAISDYTSGTVSSVGTYIITGLMGAVAGAVSGGVGAMVEGAIPAGAALFAKMGIVGGSGVLETLIENTIMGQETTGTDLIFAFIASAGLFGIGDNLLPILKRGGQAISGMVDNATKYVDDVLGDIGKRLDNTLDNLAQQIDNLSKDPYAPVLAMEGPPLDFKGQADDIIDTAVDSAHRIDARRPSQALEQPATGNNSHHEIGPNTLIDAVDRAKIDGWIYKPRDELYLKYKEVYDNPVYYDQSTGAIHWPINDGFLDGTKIESVIPQDTIFKRYGENSGEFLGNTTDTFEARALAPHSEDAPVHYYQLTEDYKMTTGRAAPWFGSNGGAEQFVVYKPDGSKYTISELEDAGILVDITDQVIEGEIQID